MIYTVFVGGTEVTAFYLSKEQAEQLAQDYIDEGYDDVAIVEVDVENKQNLQN